MVEDQSNATHLPYHVKCDPAASISEDLCIPNLQVKDPLRVHSAPDATLSLKQT